MKITERKLKRIIREEIKRLTENNVKSFLEKRLSEVGEGRGEINITSSGNSTVIEIAGANTEPEDSAQNFFGVRINRDPNREDLKEAAERFFRDNGMNVNVDVEIEGDMRFGVFIFRIKG